MFDLVIIGGGPAGATLARLAAKEMSVALIYEKRKKPCGGLLSANTQKFFAHMKMTLPVELLVDPQIFAVDTEDLAQGLHTRYQRFYINIDRQRFDEWLLSLVPKNVEIISSRVTNIEQRNNGYIVYYDENGETKSVCGKYLAGADGAESTVRKTFFPKAKTRRYVAIQQRFSVGENAPFYACLFDREVTDCCAWAITKGNELILGGAFAPENCREKFEGLKKRVNESGITLSEPLSTEACTVLRPKSVKEIFLGKGNIFLLGEAAGFVSPSSLEGISRAFESAEALSDALKTKNPERSYRKNTRRLRFGIFMKLMKCPFMYNPFLRKLVMKSKLKSIKMRTED